MTNEELAKCFRNVAASYAIQNEKKYYFQILAYQKAADSIEALTSEVSDLYKENSLQKIPGVGPSIRTHIQDLLKSGKSAHIDEILSHVPEAVFPLLDIPSFGPKKAFKLVSSFKLKSRETVIEDIKNLAEKGELAKLEGFGQKSQEDVLQAISEYSTGVTKSARMALPYATELAEKVSSYMNECKAVEKISVLGSLRRRKETIGDIDIAVATNKPQEVLDHFVSYPYKTRVIERGDATASILISGGKHIDLMVQEPKSFGSLLQHFTGSKEHNIKLREHALKKGLSLSEYGISPSSKTTKVRDNKKLLTYTSEEAFYDALGLSYIPPELREGTNEIELAKKNTLPQLVTLNDVKGDFHLHSSHNIEPSHDLGRSTFDTMTKKAISLEYHSIGFSEHNPSMKGHTPDEMISLVKKRNRAIDQAQKSNESIRIYKMLETDILPSGSLAISDEVLALLDCTIVSVHSSFSMDKDSMTKRILNGLSHKKAKILAHPSGRLINERNGYDLNWTELFSFCKKEQKAIEINAWPTRLDLRDSLVEKAIEHGVLLIISSDSHEVSHMDLMRYGVDVARRGRATPSSVINTWTQTRLTNWITR